MNHELNTIAAPHRNRTEIGNSRFVGIERYRRGRLVSTCVTGPRGKGEIRRGSSGQGHRLPGSIEAVCAGQGARSHRSAACRTSEQFQTKAPRGNGLKIRGHCLIAGDRQLRGILRAGQIATPRYESIARIGNGCDREHGSGGIFAIGIRCGRHGDGPSAYRLRVKTNSEPVRPSATSANGRDGQLNRAALTFKSGDQNGISSPRNEVGGQGSLCPIGVFVAGHFRQGKSRAGVNAQLRVEAAAGGADRVGSRRGGRPCPPNRISTENRAFGAVLHIYRFSPLARGADIGTRSGGSGNDRSICEIVIRRSCLQYRSGDN